MPKNAYFLEKGCKIAASPGGSAFGLPLASVGWGLRPPTPALLLPLADIDLWKSVSSVKTIFITLKNNTEVTNSKVMFLFLLRFCA